MSANGKARVKGGRYRIEGDFHHITPGSPIRNEDDGWKLVGITKPRTLTHIHSYGAEAPFFEALPEGRILATRCDNPACDSKGAVYLPFRIHCPDCLGRNATLDLTDTARNSACIHTFMICERSGAFNTLAKPIRFINLEFKGVCTILMSYLAVGTPEIGKKVVPIFRKKNPTYTITDLAWVIPGTRKEELPQDFDF